MGMTQYYLMGPESGPKVVLVHGEQLLFLLFWFFLFEGRSNDHTSTQHLFLFPLIIIGITPPAIVFKDLVQDMVSKGFRVLAYGE